MFFLLANPFCVNMSYHDLPILFSLYRCVLCHENKSGTIFECPSSHLLSDTDEIEFEVYSEVDLTRQSLSACATGTTMKGTLFLCFLFLIVHLQFTYIHAPFIQEFQPTLIVISNGLKLNNLSSTSANTFFK